MAIPSNALYIGLMELLIGLCLSWRDQDEFEIILVFHG